MRNFLLLASLLSFLGIANAADFSEGQVWAYKTRPGEEKSTLLINKVESHPKLGRIFHISVSGVRLKNARVPGGVTTELPHVPVSQATLEKSVTKLLRTSKPNPAYIEGYKEWKRAFDDGKAGIFTISVAEIVDSVQTAISRQ